MGRHVSLADRDKDELEYARQAAARSDRVARESEERLRLILESATDFAIITLDVQGRITGWNRGAERMFGYVDQEVYGRPGDILFIDEDRRRGDPVREMETALRQGRAANERWHLRKDGSYFWGSGTVVPLAADGEPPHGLLKIMRDRTAAKTAELELKASEARMQLAMDIADAATWDFDLVTGELYWSESHFRLLGYEPTPTGQADPHMWEQAILPDDLERVQAEWARAEKERDRFLSEHRIRRSDGAYLWARAAGSFFYDQGGRATRFVGVFFDITEQKRTEQALREADRRKDEFLAVLAHELRNPLAPIRTALELLRVSPDRAAALEQMRPLMTRQVSHMVRLIDDLLDVSRITTGRIHLQPRPTLLDELVDGAVEANRAAIDAAGVRLNVDLPAEPCVVDVDPTRFVQVLSNLLHNAAKFTNRGGDIYIRGRVETHGTSGVLTLSIRDTGVGIPAETLPYVFDLFTQGDDVARGRSGLGIGLALARQLVELHGGRIEASSQGHGRGATFTIRMPVATLPDAPQATEPERTAAQPVSRRVLVVDDNVDAAEALAMLVTALGGTAETASSGEEGLEKAREFHPDLVLLDIGMRDMDGYETCRHLRDEEAGRDATIVALTGWGQDRDRQRSLEAGFDAHMTKPADPKELRRLLER